MPKTDNLPTVYFHVGLPKTASTFLQRNVFPFFKGIQFVKKHDFLQHKGIVASTDMPAVLIYTELDLNGDSGFQKMASVARDYQGAKPIIVFRKHGAWVGSKYKYYLRKHGMLSFEDYFDMDNDNGELKEKSLRFYEKIELLEKHYGERPLVMFQEEFQYEPMKAIAAIAKYVGASYDENDIRITTVKKSYSQHSLYYVRKLNRWYKYDHSTIKSSFLKVLYKKFSGGILHLTAFVAGVFEPSKDKAKKVLPKASTARINERYAADWNRCIDYAAETREVYLKR
jgi:hypothetical protein